jgi:hypothetical protein
MTTITTIRAIIDGDTYRVGNIAANSLATLGRKLIAAGYPGDTAVECYRINKPDWDVRARSIRSAATEDVPKGGHHPAPSPSKRTQHPSKAIAGLSKKQASDLYWHRHRSLRLRVSDRTVAVVRSTGIPGLFVALVGEIVTEPQNLTRTKDHAVTLALAMLDAEHVVRAQRGRKAAAR